MKNDLEQRLLLLHLGRVLQLVARISEAHAEVATVGELIARNPILEDAPLLAHVHTDLFLTSFVARTLHAFCLWPQWLTHQPIDRNALAESVRDNLFYDNARGWKAYAAELRTEIRWFGEQERRPECDRRARERRRTARAATHTAREGAGQETSAADIALPDIVRLDEAAGRNSESVEALTRPRRASRTNEQSVMDTDERR